MAKKTTKVLLVLLIIELAAFFILYRMYYKIFPDETSFISASDFHSPQKEAEIVMQVNVTKDITEFKVNDPIDFNYKTKAEIYEIRKKFVAESLFKHSEYKPSESVFGQITGGEEWVSLKYMYYRTGESEGLSEESRFINNPSALVMLDVPFNDVTYRRYWGREMYMLPESIFYHKKGNVIKVTYSLRKFLNEIHPNLKNSFLFRLDDLNARDFGYPWVFVYDSEGITFKQNSIKSAPVKFRKFIHLGMSTGKPRNNGSPRQEELEFRIDRLSSHIYMKLWRNKPSSSSEEADINVELTFL